MFRVGFGYDSHRFAQDRPLILGGLYIEGAWGLLAHSDGDVILHALTDAILGAIGAGDIGTHFPDSDDKWKGVHSAAFLAGPSRWPSSGLHRRQRRHHRPRPGPQARPHRLAIVETIAEMLECEPNRVNLKAKTNEGMGFVGRSEGMSAYAVLLLTRTSQD